MKTSHEAKVEELWGEVLRADERLASARAAARSLQATEADVEVARAARLCALEAYAIALVTGGFHEDPEKALVAFAIDSRLARERAHRRVAA